jgi:hypothetical protein
MTASGLGILRMGGRAVEGARLESAYTSKAYRGFESHPIRQIQSDPLSPPARSPRWMAGFLGFLWLTC